MFAAILSFILGFIGSVSGGFYAYVLGRKWDMFNEKMFNATIDYMRDQGNDALRIEVGLYCNGNVHKVSKISLPPNSGFEFCDPKNPTNVLGAELDANIIFAPNRSDPPPKTLYIRGPNASSCDVRINCSAASRSPSSRSFFWQYILPRIAPISDPTADSTNINAPHKIASIIDISFT